MRHPSRGKAASKHVILFLAANPSDTGRLALDREARSIHLELKRTGYRDRFEFVTWGAAEPLDLLRELRELKPTIVHFSGHGVRSAATEDAAPDRDVVAAAVIRQSSLVAAGVLPRWPAWSAGSGLLPSGHCAPASSRRNDCSTPSTCHSGNRS